MTPDPLHLGEVRPERRVSPESSETRVKASLWDEVQQKIPQIRNALYLGGLLFGLMTCFSMYVMWRSRVDDRLASLEANSASGLLWRAKIDTSITELRASSKSSAQYQSQMLRLMCRQIGATDSFCPDTKERETP